MKGREPGAPVIVVKKKGGHGGHHGGAWKVAYADFVTAMMAFFMVMWIIGQSQKVKQNVAGYFSDPVGFQTKTAAGILDGGAGVTKDASPSQPAEPAPDPEAAIRAALTKAAEEILRVVSSIPGLQDLMGQIDVEVTSEGLRINLTDAGEKTFFDVGSAKLSPNGAKILSAIANVIAPLGMKMSVEGHTDARPYVGRTGYTNWELSADRANAARRILELAGVSPEQITAIRGYADRLLRYPQDPLDPRNRRVSIIVRKNSGAEFGSLTPQGLPIRPEPENPRPKP